MKKVINAIRRFIFDECGSPTVEYVAIIIGVLGLVIGLFAVINASKNKVDEAANFIENFDFNGGTPSVTDIP